MSKLRPNRKSGQGKHVNLGFLGKYKTYKNTEFKELPTLSKEEEQQLLIDALKPYSYTPSKHRSVRAAGPKGAIAPSPTPTSSVTPTLTPTITPTLTPTMTLTPTPSLVTFYLLTAQSDTLQTAGGDNILWTT